MAKILKLAGEITDSDYDVILNPLSFDALSEKINHFFYYNEPSNITDFGAVALFSDFDSSRYSFKKEEDDEPYSRKEIYFRKKIIIRLEKANGNILIPSRYVFVPTNELEKITFYDLVDFKTGEERVFISAQNSNDLVNRLMSFFEESNSQVGKMISPAKIREYLDRNL
jgi:hypothetical protein